MTHRKRRQPTPHFKLPPSFDPMTGEHAGLQVPGVSPNCALMQVAAEDTHDDYVVCRGYDTRVKRFFDYVEGDTDKIGISVAKPYGSRTAGSYQVGQMFAALLPLGRLGQTPSVAATSEGHPADLDEEVEILYDENDKVINWMLVGAGERKLFGKLDDELTKGGTATMSIWTESPLADSGDNEEVTDWLLGTGETIAVGKKVVATRYYGVWYVTSAEC